MIKIFRLSNLSQIDDYFVKNGFCIIRGLYNSKQVKDLEKLIKNIDKKYHKHKNTYDNQIFSIVSHKIFEKTDLFDKIYKNQNLIKALKVFFGTDIIQINFSRFQINRKNNKLNLNKDDTKFQQFKGIHNDHWTGSSEYTIHYWMPFSGIDKNNGLTVYPGSHLNGSFPVVNREIDKKIKFKYKELNLNSLRNGDVVLFHSLLLHKTSGKSQKTRMAALSRFACQNYRLTKQELDLGFKSISVGPMRRIIRTIGNDMLTPFRTYGSVSGIDRVIYEVYQDSKLDKKIEDLYNKLKK